MFTNTEIRELNMVKTTQRNTMQLLQRISYLKKTVFNPELFAEIKKKKKKQVVEGYGKLR